MLKDEWWEYRHFKIGELLTEKKKTTKIINKNTRVVLTCHF